MTNNDPPLIPENPGQSVEEFMKAHFQQLTFEIEQALRRAFLRKWPFARDNDLAHRRWIDSREKVLRAIEPHHAIQSIKTYLGTAEVITGGNHRAGSGSRWRYKLRANGNSWTIESTEWECSVCPRDNYDAACPACKGTGWQDKSYD
jgi:hypothetical protein